MSTPLSDPPVTPHNETIRLNKRAVLLVIYYAHMLLGDFYAAEPWEEETMRQFEEAVLQLDREVKL